MSPTTTACKPSLRWPLSLLRWRSLNRPINHLAGYLYVFLRGPAPQPRWWPQSIQMLVETVNLASSQHSTPSRERAAMTSSSHSPASITPVPSLLGPLQDLPLVRGSAPGSTASSRSALCRAESSPDGPSGNEGELDRLCRLPPEG